MVIYGIQDLHVGKISGQKSFPWFFCGYHIRGGKPSKMIETRERMSMGPYRFELFLVSLDSTYWENISLKAVNHFGQFSRK
jgi:hypothetical protein